MQRLVDTEVWKEQLEQAVARKTNGIRSLLDNAGQGLLSFGQNLLVHEGYSMECNRIFGDKIEHKLFSHLIFPEDKSEAGFINQVLHEVFQSNDSMRIKVYLSMLPREIKLGDSFINLEYKIISNIYSSEAKAVMVIITEVTDKKLLEDRVKEDERIIRMVANVAANFSSFMECVREFQYFYGSKLHVILESGNSTAEIFADIYRDIHTHKGSFSQFEMYHSVENLHAMESALTAVGNAINSFTYQDFRSFIYSFDILNFLEEDMNLLKEKLGGQFFSIGDTVQVEKSKLTDMEREIMEICSPMECKTLLPMVKSFRFKPLKELLSTYPEYTMKLADRLEKSINAFAIDGDDIYVDSDKYSSFIKSLVHVFRNSVDHGFPTIGEAMEDGSGRTGTINCRISEADGFIKLVIEDNGNGIDFERIRNKAVEYGLYTGKQACQLSEEMLLPLIFRENFSTKDMITDVSGRGMGLSAVKTETEKLGGSLKVYTKKDEGTRLEFLIPRVDVEQIEHLEPKAVIEPILSTTLDFLQEHFQNEWKVIKIVPFNSNNFILQNYTAFISIKGLFDGSFAISMDNSIAASLLKRVLIDCIDPQAETAYTKDVIAESANMILGNSIKDYPNIQEMIIIGTPHVIYSSDGGASYDGNLITGYMLETDKGTVVMSIIQ